MRIVKIVIGIVMILLGGSLVIALYLMDGLASPGSATAIESKLLLVFALLLFCGGFYIVWAAEKKE